MIQELISEEIESDEIEGLELELEECIGHEYEFIDTIPSGSESYILKHYVCILCNNDKVVKFHFGVRD
ncbi:MAG TPA: hypothetical protein VJ729_16585 [Nitrososphaeraceae archaeon]|nr:hypothetical protein [Nitrososphaeraceae archaeon]